MNDDDVIDIGSDDELASEDEQEIELATVDSELCELQRKIEKLANKKETLLAKKHMLLDRIKDRKCRQNSLEIAQTMEKENKVVSPETEQKLKDMAQKYFNISSFRSLQLETMLTTLRNEDCILIMPTGGGKSLTFQLPAIVSPGVTVVVSPLISLMEDQVSGLEKQGVGVAMVTGSTSQERQAQVHKEMASKDATIKLVYVTPEKIAKAKRFQTAMEKSYEAGLLKRIVIDEVHCVSQWGHDFRPDYKILGTMKRQYPRTPILGLTATATERVLADVQSVLHLPHCKVLRAGFNRTNLFYEITAKASNPPLVAEQIANMVKGRFSGQSGLVYCYSRNDCEVVMANLQKYNLKVAYYHAQLSMGERKQVHHMWLNNEIQCIVATVAFGMGIDKPDVRFIIHHTMSKTIENYYQESGRAGRDGKPAYCVLLFQPTDFFKITTMACQESAGTGNSYEMLRYCIATQCRRVNLAKHFGEHFTAAECAKMCDTCKDERKWVVQDVTYYALEVLAIINSADKDLTFSMLLAAWKIKRSEKTRRLSLLYLDRVILQMLADKILEEKFKAGMFKPNSYCVSGGYARSVKNGTKQLYLDIPPSHASQFVQVSQQTLAASQLEKPAGPAGPTHAILTKSKAPSKKRKKAIVFDSDESD